MTADITPEAVAKIVLQSLAAERDTLRVQLDATLKDRALIIAERVALSARVNELEAIVNTPAVLAALPETQAMVAAACYETIARAKDGLFLIPADHAAALAARDAKMRAEGWKEGMERAAVIVDDHYAKGDMGNPGHFIHAEMGGEP